MRQNEIRAVMDVVKMVIQSLIVFFFALLLLATQGKVLVLEIYWGLSAIALVTLTLLIRKYKYLGRQLDIIGDQNVG